MATARPRPQVMRLTDAAAMRIKDVMARAERPVAGVRVGVKNGGCAGMEYTMEYATAINPTDEVVEDKASDLVDPRRSCSCRHRMDYKTEKLSAQFVFQIEPDQCLRLRQSVQLSPAKDDTADARKSAAGFLMDADTIRDLFAELGRCTSAACLAPAFMR